MDSFTTTRPLGLVEESWTKGTSQGTGITVLGALFNLSIHGELICAAMQQLLDRHPLLRSQICENAKSKHCIQTHTHCSAGKHVHEKTWPSVSGQDYTGVVIFPNDHQDKHGSLALHKVINEELNFNFLNPDGKPCAPLRVFHVNFYPNLERRQTVIALKFHGGIFDRQSSSVISQDFFATLGRHVKGIVTQAIVDSRSATKQEENCILPAVEDLIPKAKASKSIWQKSIEAVGYAVYAKIYSLLPFQPGFSRAWIRRPPLESNFVSLNLGKHGACQTVTYTET